MLPNSFFICFFEMGLDYILPNDSGEYDFIW